MGGYHPTLIANGYQHSQFGDMAKPVLIIWRQGKEMQLPLLMGGYLPTHTPMATSTLGKQSQLLYVRDSTSGQMF